ncbi:MAG: hypothetical protein WC742_15425 [Gallionellaceae bacterium]|jgi:hypothetical protein
MTSQHAKDRAAQLSISTDLLRRAERFPDDTGVVLCVRRQTAFLAIRKFSARCQDVVTVTVEERSVTRLKNWQVGVGSIVYLPENQ